MVKLNFDIFMRTLSVFSFLEILADHDESKTEGSRKCWNDRSVKTNQIFAFIVISVNFSLATERGNPYLFAFCLFIARLTPVLKHSQHAHGVMILTVCTWWPPGTRCHTTCRTSQAPAPPGPRSKGCSKVSGACPSELSPSQTRNQSTWARQSCLNGSRIKHWFCLIFIFTFWGVE